MNSTLFCLIPATLNKSASGIEGVKEALAAQRARSESITDSIGRATSSDATLAPSVNTTAAVWIQTHAFTPSKHIEAWSLVKSAATWIGNFRPGHCYKQKQSFWAPCRLIALKALNDLCRNWEHMRDQKDMSFSCFSGIKSLQDWGKEDSKRFK